MQEDREDKPETGNRNTEEWASPLRPAHLISRAARLFARIGDVQFRALGFSTSQLPVLASLKNGQALSQKELTRIACIEQPSMAQMLARMERDGIIQRTPDPKDARSSLVTLTDTAMARLPELRAIMFQGSDEALKGLSLTEIETLAALLRRVIANLEEMASRQAGE